MIHHRKTGFCKKGRHKNCRKYQHHVVGWGDTFPCEAHWSRSLLNCLSRNQKNRPSPPKQRTACPRCRYPPLNQNGSTLPHIFLHREVHLKQWIVQCHFLLPWKDTESLRGKSATNPFLHNTTRWAPTSYKWSYNLYKWPYKWVTGVITLLMGVITPFITDRGPPCTDD